MTNNTPSGTKKHHKGTETESRRQPKCTPPPSLQVEHILHELEEEYRQSVLSKLAALGQEVPPGVDPLDLVLESDLESSDAGSDSSVSDGPPVHLVGKVRGAVPVHQHL